MKEQGKLHTTNYFDTFITVADDCPVAMGEIPAMKGEKKTIAKQQFDVVSKHPYEFTSDDVLFQVYAERNDLTGSEYEEARQQFFSKGQACFRASPLPKRYGWGIHCDSNGKMALYGVETEAYQKYINDTKVKKVKAMRTSKK